MGKVNFEDKVSLRPDGVHNQELRAEDVNEIKKAINDNDSSLKKCLKWNSNGKDTNVFNEKGELIDVQTFVAEYNKIMISGFRATYFSVNGTKENILPGDLALNRLTPSGEFIPLSEYKSGPVEDGASWEIKSTAIKLGLTQED